MEINKNAVAAFFDRRAAGWDANSSPQAAVIEAILDCAGVQSGVRVLDVGCGTGVLFPYYLSRGAAAVTGVDLSPGMIAQAQAKFGADTRVSFLCADAAEAVFAPHDVCLTFNALPHFPSAEALIRSLANVLAPGGRLTVAHGESRRVVNARHRVHASEISHDLLPADELAALFAPLFRVDALRDGEDYYLVSGVRIGLA